RLLQRDDRRGQVRNGDVRIGRHPYTGRLRRSKTVGTATRVSDQGAGKGPLPPRQGDSCHGAAEATRPGRQPESPARDEAEERREGGRRARPRAEALRAGFDRLKETFAENRPFSLHAGSSLRGSATGGTR